MRRGIIERGLGAAGLIIAGVTLSCGLGLTGESPVIPPADASAATEATGDATAGSSTTLPDGGEAGALVLRCGATPVASCADCKLGAVACPTTGQCVTSCVVDCAPATIACVGCRGGVAEGTCEPAASASCVLDPSYLHCSCATTPECAGANQICVGGTCRSCGEPDTVELECRDGTGKKKCKLDDSKPENLFQCK